MKNEKYLGFESNMDKNFYNVTPFWMVCCLYANFLDCQGSKKGKEKPMILTKQYFKTFQFRWILVAILSAAIIGSIQTALIIYKGKRKGS